MPLSRRGLKANTAPMTDLITRWIVNLRIHTARATDCRNAAAEGRERGNGDEKEDEREEEEETANEGGGAGGGKVANKEPKWFRPVRGHRHDG